MHSKLCEVAYAQQNEQALMHSLNRNIASENDDDIDHRIADSAAGHDAWLSFRLSDEERDVGATTKVAAGLRVRRDGCGFGMVIADSCDKDGIR